MNENGKITSIAVGKNGVEFIVSCGLQIMEDELRNKGMGKIIVNMGEVEDRIQSACTMVRKSLFAL